MTTTASTTANTTSTATTAAVAGPTLAAGTWPLDVGRSNVGFAVRLLGLFKVRGRFDRFDATLDVGGSPADSRAEATVEMSSVDTRQSRRDAHLRSTTFFAADEHPRMTFRSTGVRDAGDGRYALDGDLTVHGVTRPVTLAVEPDGPRPTTPPAGGPPHARFTATTTVNRDDFGVGYHAPLGLDRLAIGKKVAIDLDLRFVAPES